MTTFVVILARAGSKGLPDKCVLPLCGRPVLDYTLEDAHQCQFVVLVILSTDSPQAAAVALNDRAEVVERTPELAADTAPVDAAVRHAVETHEARTTTFADVIVILYGNVPVRADGIIDRCVEHLVRTGCDSVRTVAPVTKQHPDWIHRLHGDRIEQFRKNSIHRRQDLEPLYYHDGAVVVVRRESLFDAGTSQDPHAFFGQDRQAVTQREEDTVDIDTLADLYRAEAAIRMRSEIIVSDPPIASRLRPPITGAVTCGDGHERR